MMEGGTFYEFFAGGGMARMGLGKEWSCLFANDFDDKKGEVYRQNWKDGVLVIDDVRRIDANDLPDLTADLAWASFPCQDLSLAGAGAGLSGRRSGSFWAFWKLMKALAKKSRAPRLIALENVCGTLTSHDGKDFAAICTELRKGGYRFGAMVMDAAYFVPQSRPRLFIVAVRNDMPVPETLGAREHPGFWSNDALLRAFEKLSVQDKKSWVWWRVPAPPRRRKTFSDIIEDNPSDVDWHTPGETRRLRAMMSPVNQAKVDKAGRMKKRQVGAVYKRTRLDERGNKVQRAEVRFDDVAGCLRTPAGGSSRQLIMVVEGEKVRTRLISARETARLMGIPDHYKLPQNYHDAYHLTGDGVVVPVVRHLAKHLLAPVLRAGHADLEEAA